MLAPVSHAVNERVDVVVIGGGPAGISAASEAARGGGDVLLVEEAVVGGRADQGSLLPSKIWLHAAARRIAAKRPRALATRDDVLAVQRDIAHHLALSRERAERTLSDAAVRRLAGAARFLDAHTLEVTSGTTKRVVGFDHAIVATGSVPRVPEGFLAAGTSPDGETIALPRHLRTLTALPPSALVIGAGATGAELVCLLDAFGVEVTWLVDELGILPRFDRDIASSLGDVLFERGVKVVHGKRTTSVGVRTEAAADVRVEAKLEGGRTYAAAMGFLAIGRTPDTSRLGLPAAGVELTAQGHVVVDEGQRSSIPHILAVGDIVEGPYSASRATAQGLVAARAARGAAFVPVDARFVVEVAYTEPPIAKVGVAHGQLGEHHIPFEARSVEFDASLRARLRGVGQDPHTRGLLRVVLDERSVIRGATAIGPEAPELVSAITIAMRGEIPATELETLALASPSFLELVSIAARG